MENIEKKQEGGDKVAQQFESNFKKLLALLGGGEAFKRTKVPNDEVGNIVADLIREKKEEFMVNFKSKAKDLLDKKMDFDKEIKKAEEDFKKIVLDKKKEFSSKMVELFNMVENIQDIEKSYYESISEVKESSEENKEE